MTEKRLTLGLTRTGDWGLGTGSLGTSDGLEIARETYRAYSAGDTTVESNAASPT